MNRENFINKVNEVINKLKDFGCEIREYEISEVATNEEIQILEKEIGKKIPDSLKRVFMNISKKCVFSSYFPDNIKFSGEFKELGGIEFEWDMNALYTEDIHEFEWLEEDFKEFSKNNFDLGNIDYFFNVTYTGNGDMLVVPENSNALIYWSHEGEGMVYLASNFEEFLNKVLDLYGLGMELWAYKVFITEKGLVSDSEVVDRYKSLIDYIIDKRKNEQFEDIEDLFKYISFLVNLDEISIKELNNYEDETLFKRTLFEIENRDPFDRRVYYQIMATRLKNISNDWILSQYSNKDTDIWFKDLAYLIAETFDASLAFKMISEYLKKNELKNGKISAYSLKVGFKKIKDHSVNRLIFDFIKENEFENDKYYIADLILNKKMEWKTVKEWIHCNSKLRDNIAYSLSKYRLSFISDFKEGSISKEELTREIKFIMSNEVLENINRELRLLIKEEGL